MDGGKWWIILRAGHVRRRERMIVPHPTPNRPLWSSTTCSGPRFFASDRMLRLENLNVVVQHCVNILLLNLQIPNYFKDAINILGVFSFTMMGIWVQLMRRNGPSVKKVRWSPMPVAPHVRQNVRSCPCVYCLFVVHGETHARRAFISLRSMNLS